MRYLDSTLPRKRGRWVFTGDTCRNLHSRQLRLIRHPMALLLLPYLSLVYLFCPPPAFRFVWSTGHLLPSSPRNTASSSHTSSRWYLKSPKHHGVFGLLPQPRVVLRCVNSRNHSQKTTAHLTVARPPATPRQHELSPFSSCLAPAYCSILLRAAGLSLPARNLVRSNPFFLQSSWHRSCIPRTKKSNPPFPLADIDDARLALTSGNAGPKSPPIAQASYLDFRIPSRVLGSRRFKGFTLNLFSFRLLSRNA